MNENTSLTRIEQQPVAMQQGGVIRLADKLASVVESFQQYTQACEALLTKDDYQGIGGRSFKKKSAWRKIATAFSISSRIIAKEVVYDEDGRLHHAEFIVEASAPNGRTMQAWGGASRVDRDFSHDQDVAATAETRATNRAIANLIGCGEVSAEEMLAEKKDNYQKPAAATHHDAPAVDSEINAIVTVEMVTERQGTGKNGKPWKAWFCLLKDGSDTNLEAGTFSASIGQIAQSLEQSGDQAQAHLKPGRKAGTWEIVSLTPELPEVIP